MSSRLKQWWRFDPEEETASADNPHAPLRDDQRRETLPLLTLAFGWGFLVTGLIVGGALGKGLTFGDIITATFLGNSVNFLIGAAVAYVGYKTACNSGLLYRQVFGTLGAAGPVILVALLTIGWQGIIVGAFGFAWTQSFDSSAFYAVAVFAGLLFTATTYFGVKGLEAVSIPATLVLLAVGIYAGWMNVSAAGGWDAFLAQSDASASEAPLTMVQAINLVIGSWIVGAIVMPEYSRFAKKAWVAIAIPFIVLIISQWFLQVVGAMGGIVSGTHDFTTYMLAQGAIIGGIGVIAMSLALWTTGDANLYLPAVQTASVFKRPQRVMTVLCGIAGTIIGLGIYEQFLFWIDLLATIAPPLVGPLIAQFYLGGRENFSVEALAHPPVINLLAFLAYAIGVVAALNAPPTIANALVGLVVSVVAYWLLSLMMRLLRNR